MATCLTCLREAPHGELHHARCARRLFGTNVAPRLDLGLAQIQSVALATIGRSSLAGVQRKISIGLQTQRQTLRVELDGGGRYILKPQAPEFPNLPENEQVSMELARLFGLAVPDTTLLELSDGSLACLVARFDRPATGGKRRQEDFCQLRSIPPSAKYEGAATDCVDVIRRFSAEPGADLVRLFETFVFAYWIGNGDLHQKNLSLLEDSAGRHLLSPVYDQLCTALYPGLNSSLGLPLVPGSRRADATAWKMFGDGCEIPPRGLGRIMGRPVELLAEATDILQRSYLHADLGDRYSAVLMARAQQLAIVRERIMSGT